VTYGLEICTETASGSTEGSYVTQAERVPLVFLDESPRRFLQVGNASSGVGFGGCVGELKPARAVQWMYFSHESNVLVLSYHEVGVDYRLILTGNEI
jgi:hypothetical protein